MSHSESAKINSYEKGAEKVSATLKGGGGSATSFGVFLTRWLEVLAILKELEGAKHF